MKTVQARLLAIERGLPQTGRGVNFASDTVNYNRRVYVHDPKTGTVYGEEDLTGIVGGLNIHAPHAARALQALKLITDQELELFLTWYEEERAKYQQESDLKRLHFEADRLGYTLTERGKP